MSYFPLSLSEFRGGNLEIFAIFADAVRGIMEFFQVSACDKQGPH
jgi:hypothetical protein